MKTLLSPLLWFFELFTTAKSFRNNPIIGSPLLNKLGLHVGRVVIAHFIMHLRMAMLSWRVAPADRRSFRQQGFILRENFLPADEFAALEQEVRHFQGKPRCFRQGDTETCRTLLDPDTQQALPHTRTFLENKTFQHLICYANAHLRLPFFNIERIRNGVHQGDSDPQKDLHSDTFHPTMKFWFYLDDVDTHNGPFLYIPGSQRLSRERLRWEYTMSQTAYQHPNRLAGRGSPRFSPADLAAAGLPEPRAFKVSKNTLLIANTFGVHGRGQADPGSSRLALWGMSRTNPFIPFPGSGLRFFNHYQYKVLKWLEQRR